MAPLVSLLKWYFVLSPTSDEGQTTVIPHKLYSILQFLSAMVLKSLKMDHSLKREDFDSEC